MSFNLRSLKIIVLASFTIFTLLSFIFSDARSSTTQASSGGAPTGRTGAPGESTCTSCHGATANTGQFSIIAPANYVPGQSYTIQVQNTTNDLSRRAWGFELIPLTDTNTMAGSVANLNTNTRIRTPSGSTKNYVTQTSAGSFSGQTGGSVWSFSWTAPASAVGAVTMYATGLQADDDGGEGGDQTYTSRAVIQPAQAVAIHHGFTDFDGDGKADTSVFRPGDRTWYINRGAAGLTGTQWGNSTDRITPADFDGDDKTDIAVWREGPSNVAAYYILQSSTNTVRAELFGQTGDDPTVTGDWDGDGKADPAVFRDSAIGSQSYFYFRGSLNNPNATISYRPWGLSGDRSMRGDFDGDGKLDLAVYRPSTAIWYINQSSTGVLRYEYWGLPTDKFVPADYDGDSKTDLAVFRGGIWYIKQSSNNQIAYYQWGLNTDVLTPADFDGDGKTDPAIYRNGIWYIRQSSSASMGVQFFGFSSDKPIASAYVK